MITEHRFSDLTQYQRRLDAEIDAQVCFCRVCWAYLKWNE